MKHNIQMELQSLLPFRFTVSGVAIIIASCLLILFAAPQNALAKTSSNDPITVSNTQEKIALGSFIYHTVDEEGRLTYQALISRHKNGVSGGQDTSSVKLLAIPPAANWLIFDVTNNTDEMSWVLDFGSLVDGRIGQVLKLVARNNDRGESYSEFIGTSGLKINITPNKTERIVIYTEAKRGLPLTISPHLLTETLFIDHLRHGSASLWVLALKSLLIAVIGAFAAMAFISRERGYALFSLLYAGHLLELILLNSVFLSASILGSIFTQFLWAGLGVILLVATFFFLDIRPQRRKSYQALRISGILMVACGLLSFAPIGAIAGLQTLAIVVSILLGLITITVISVGFAQRGYYAAYYYSGALLITLIGLFISTLNINGSVIASAWGVSFYWLLLPLQAIFFLIASGQRLRLKDTQRHDTIAREQRAAYARVRLDHSRETTDQARLMRVIERERELMSGLREREILRTEEEREAKEMADAANSAKSAFLAVVSHEIRTPMTGLRGMIKLLEHTDLNTKQADYVLTLQKTSDTMLVLLNDILDFEKIESGNMTLEHISFDLKRLVEDIITLMNVSVKDKDVELLYEISQDFPDFIMGDPTRLRQVLWNLTTNALKFTEKGSVTIILRAIALQKSGDSHSGDFEIYFGVKDTGAGISEEGQKALFTPFKQADKTIARKYGGTGLGLTICQRLVKLMKGSIKLESREGEGSTFHFSLIMDEGEQVEVATGEVSEPVKKTDTAQDEPVKQSIPPMMIMVIEDNEINLEVLKNFIEGQGHKTILCSSGEEALEKLGALQESDAYNAAPDAIFTDINLTGIDGLEVAKYVRSMEKSSFSKLPIVAVSGDVREEDAKRIHGAGISAMLAKPIDYNKMIAMIADIYYRRIKPIPVLDDLPDAQDDTIEVSEVSEDSVIEVSKTVDVLDIEILNGLVDALGKDATVDLVKACIDKAPEMIDALGQGIEQTDVLDFDILYARAHDLKGMAGNFGLAELAEFSAQIEALAKAQSKNAIIAAIKKLPDAYRRAQKSIDAWLA